MNGLRNQTRTAPVPITLLKAHVAPLYRWTALQSTLFREWSASQTRETSVAALPRATPALSQHAECLSWARAVVQTTAILLSQTKPLNLTKTGKGRSKHMPHRFLISHHPTAPSIVRATSRPTLATTRATCS